MPGWPSKQMQKNTADFVRGFDGTKGVEMEAAKANEPKYSPQEMKEFRERQAAAAQEQKRRDAKAKAANDKLRHQKYERLPTVQPTPSALEVGHTKSSFEDID